MMQSDMSYTTLQKIADIRAGYPFREVVQDDPNGDAAVIQVKNVDEIDGIQWKEVVRTNLTGRRLPDWLEKGDILFAARGQRNFAVALDDLDHPTVCTPHFFRVHIRRDEPVLPDYLAWFINQAPAKHYFRKSAEGSLVRSIRKDVLGKLNVAIPPVEEQRTIVQLLETLKQEQRLLQRMEENSRHLMNTIANRILKQG